MSCDTPDNIRLVWASQSTGLCLPSPELPANQSYLHCDGRLLGHGLVRADEGHIVIQVVDGALGSGEESGAGSAS